MELHIIYHSCLTEYNNVNNHNVNVTDSESSKLKRGVLPAEDD